MAKPPIPVDFDFTCYAPDLLTPLDGSQVIIRAEVVVHDPVARQSGKHIHLGMTPADAMRLLAQLRSVQQQFAWPDASGQGETIVVPPEREKH